MIRRQRDGMALLPAAVARRLTRRRRFEK